MILMYLEQINTLLDMIAETQKVASEARMVKWRVAEVAAELERLRAESERLRDGLTAISQLKATDGYGEEYAAGIRDAARMARRVLRRDA